MIIILKPSATQNDIDKFSSLIEQKYNVRVSTWQRENSAILSLFGNTENIDVDFIQAQNIVSSVKRIQAPYKKVGREFKPNNTVIKLENGQAIGDGRLGLIAGPCSVESEEQIITIAKAVKKSGANFLRGGAFKPRTSPYAFQGLMQEGLNLLKLAKKESGLPIVTEITRISSLPLFEDIDILQVGARNMQNFELLKELGKINKPVILKRSLSSTIEEFLMSAEYIISKGNNNVILCERGIRTYETFTRNTLDISAVPILKKLSHLPVIVDPSHASGLSWLVKPLSFSAIAAGADGLMIEVHNDPSKAMSDGPQSITFNQFNHITKNALKIHEMFSKIYNEDISI